MRSLIERGLHRIWYGGHGAYFLLLPVSWLYGGAVALRRALYRIGLLRSFSAGCPVIIVGNLTTGGSGKTPLVIWLVKQLTAMGLKPGVASRGYGGAGGPVPLSVNSECDPLIVGDEPLLIAKRTGAAVTVAKDRVAAARHLASQGVDIVVCDDGLQHYRLRRDLEILVIDGQRRLGNRRLLPAGPLREPPSRLETVDVVINNSGSPTGSELAMTLTANEIVNLSDGSRRAIHSLAGENWHALAGIGNPERFFSFLEGKKIMLTRHVHSDHARLGRRDIVFADKLPVLMTEKDAVKCTGFAPDNCWYLPVNADIEDSGEVLVQLIKKAVN